MPVIVDTYNVLHVTGVLHPERAGVDVGGLASLVAASRFASEAVWLVCDGTARRDVPRSRGRVLTVFAGPGRSADDHIGHMIEASTAPRRLTVVSSDLQIGRMARRRRCRWMRAEEFLARLEADAQLHPGGGPRRPMPSRERGRVPLDAREVDQWLRHFGVDDAGVSEAGSHAPARDGPAEWTGAGEGLERSAEAQETLPRGQAGGAGVAGRKGQAERLPGGNARRSQERGSHRGERGGPPGSARAASDGIDWTSVELAGEDLASVDFAAVMEAALAAIPRSPRSSSRAPGGRATGASDRTNGPTAGPAPGGQGKRS